MSSAKKQNKGADKGAPAVPPEDSKPPMAFIISRQLDQEKINYLSKRIEELLRSNKEIRSSSSQNEKDTHDIVLYFQREMEIKDDIVLKLNEELVKCQTQLKFEVERARKQFEEEMAELRANSDLRISALSAQLANAESELKAVEMFRLEKENHEELVKSLQRELQQQREQFIDAMEEQERRFLEEKSNIFRDLEDQKAAFREVALQEARAAMGEDMRKLLADNARMFEELKFHHSEASDSQAERKMLKEALATARTEVAIFAEKEMEYAKQAHYRSKEIKALRERVEQLEKQQALNLEKFKSRAKEIKATVNKELEEATLDAAGLRRLIHIKNKELRHMKSLAATILSQRTETEQFFLEALQEVKEVVREERRAAVDKQQKAIHQKQMTLSGALVGVTDAVTGEVVKAGNTANKPLSAGKKTTTIGGKNMFPPLNVKAANMHLLESRRQAPELNLAELEKVTITELSWEDKELVLRVLFSKMNGAGQITHAANMQNMPNLGSGVNHPVFLSEGLNLPYMDQNLQMFEVGSLGTSAGSLGESAHESPMRHDEYLSMNSSMNSR